MLQEETTRTIVLDAPATPAPSSTPWWPTTQPRPPRARRAHLRAPAWPQGRRHLQDRDRPAHPERHRQRVLPTLPGQAVPQGRPCLRIETVSNDADDIGCQRLLPNLDDLQAKARAINQRLLDTQAGRPGHGPCESSLRADRAAHRHRRWQQGPSPAVRRPSGQALTGTLANLLFAVTAITNKRLRALMTGRSAPYSLNQTSYDLARLRRNGLITRIPGHNQDTLTPTASGSRSSPPRSTTASSDPCPPPAANPRATRTPRRAPRHRPHNRPTPGHTRLRTAA
jgi:hypothetical protein